MKTWLLLSLLLPLFSSGYTLLTKSALSKLEPASFSSYSLLIASILIITYNVVKGKKIEITTYSTIGGLAFGLAVMGLTIGIDDAPNPGLAAALYRTQTVLTAVLSVFFFGYQLNIEGIVGMMVTLFGAYLIATDHKEAVKTDEPGVVPGKSKRRLDQSNWFIYPTLAGVALTVKDLTGMASLKSGMAPSVFAVSQ
jgi:drug/metabolite transporter (DMT)-like permease